jgi:hypothetical protein
MISRKNCNREPVANRAAAHFLRMRRRNLLKNLEVLWVGERFGHFLKTFVVYIVKQPE